MKLKDAMLNISNDRNWAIYAQYPLHKDTECRYGQTIFENGGLLDDKEFIINGEQVNAQFEDIDFNDDDLNIEYQYEIAIEHLIDELNDEHNQQ